MKHLQITGVKPSVGHFRIFGSLCFRHVPEQISKKLDDRSQAMILVGYHSTRDYKLFSPNENKVVINRDVQFDESKSWNWHQNSDSSKKNTKNPNKVRTVLEEEE